MEYIESLKYFKNRKTGRKMIPYGRQTIEEDDIQAVVDVLRSDYLTTGPKIAELRIMSGRNMRWRFQTEHRHFMRHVLQQGFSRGMK